ncbi:MAG: hypothetical protein ABIP78_08195 [Pyrinomonadaceae bacterium]
MNAEFEKIKKNLADISAQIENQKYRSNTPRAEWAGADVVITSATKQSTKSAGFYPQPRTVVTPFSKELSWLFSRLRDAFAGLIDGTSKIEFYGRLANAARDYQNAVNGDGNDKDILLAVLYEAVMMLEEMEEGTFDYLTIATGNTILADLVSKSEKSGYIGVEATEDFFRKMETAHRES